MWEAPREGTVLSLLNAEWKVSDTGSSHWASSLDVQSETMHEIIGQKYVNHQAEGFSTDFIGKKRWRNLRMTTQLQFADNA